MVPGGTEGEGWGRDETKGAEAQIEKQRKA